LTKQNFKKKIKFHVDNIYDMTKETLSYL